MLCGFLRNDAHVRITHTPLMIDTACSVKPADKQRIEQQYREARRERAKKKAIVQMKLKNGCVKPDRKKIAAAKAAEENETNKH